MGGSPGRVCSLRRACGVSGRRMRGLLGGRQAGVFRVHSCSRVGVGHGLVSVGCQDPCVNTEHRRGPPGQGSECWPASWAPGCRTVLRVNSQAAWWDLRAPFLSLSFLCNGILLPSKLSSSGQESPRAPTPATLEHVLPARKPHCPRPVGGSPPSPIV